MRIRHFSIDNDAGFSELLIPGSWPGSTPHSILHCILPMKRTRMLPAISFTGLIAGTLDALAAIVNYLLAGGSDPSRIFMYIASGVFGRDAVNANPQLAWWGVIFHYFIAFCWTGFYFFLYPKATLLSRNVVVSGISYGLFVWLVMNLVVLPLSNVTRFPFAISRALIGAGILIICIGLPIAILARRYSTRTDSP
jgi:hypothetical protein